MRRISTDGVIARHNHPGKGLTGFRNNVLASDTPLDDDSKLRPLRQHDYKNDFLESRDMKDIDAHPVPSQTLPSTIQFMPSTAGDDFAEEVFSTEEFSFLRQDKPDDVAGLGNSSVRSVSTQASDNIMFQRSQQALDPFSPDPIQESQQQGDQQQQMQQEQEREQECQRLQLQIQHLQNRIVLLNNNRDRNQPLQQQPRQFSNNTGSNYLCNGVAAIEPGDRGTITPPFSETLPQNSNNSSSNYFDNTTTITTTNNNHFENCTDELLLDPTPITCPFGPPDMATGNAIGIGCVNSNMRRSISFGSFP